MEKPIYVIGHRNPDTDSICSAIGYAHLKEKLGEPALPARAGKINAETKFVLEYFNMHTPLLINDLYPRVKDVMTEASATVKPEHTVRKLGMIMKQYKLKSVAVTDENCTLKGIVSVGDMAKRYFTELDIEDLCYADVDFMGILKCLDGVAVTGIKKLSQKIKGKIKIAGGSLNTIDNLVQRDDVLIVGDRKNVHDFAIDKGIACLILAAGADMDQLTMQKAEQKGVIIIRSEYDSYTCTRLINQSIPVSMLMQTNVTTFKPMDLLADIKKVVAKNNYRAYPVVENGKFIGMVHRGQLFLKEKENIILVDHNEKSQAVEGIEEAKIIEIIDHHRLGGLETSEPIFIRHEPVGCTATIVANMHWHRNIVMPPAIAGVLLSAIISDTVLFKSPTCTVQDKEVAENLAKIAGLDINEYGMKLLHAGSVVNQMSTPEIVNNDLKEFIVGDKKLAIGQITVMDKEEVLSRKQELADAQEALRKKENYHMVLTMVTDILKENTYLVYAGKDNELLINAFGNIGEEKVIFLPNVLSRKKQVVPPLVEAAAK